MQTVIETKPYLAAAADAGMTDDEKEAVKDLLARNPEAGEMMVGTGGCRKVRVAGKGKGKSGGYRVITYFATTEVPLFLITVFAKGDRANLTKAERNDLGILAKKLVESLNAPA